MNNEKMPNSEVDMLSTAINRIISAEVLEKIISDSLPTTEDLTDSNKIYQGKVSVLFVDIRDSSKLPEAFNKEQLVKIYRSYVRNVVQAIRYSGGVVRDFMGDGILAIFYDDDSGVSEDKSVYAARYISTAVDKVLNPILDEVLNYRISCGIGIHTGEVSISKVGMKGKEQDDGFENEYGIAWIGNSTNMACKFSRAVECETIFISHSTYANLTSVDAKINWRKTEIINEKNVLIGYVA